MLDISLIRENPEIIKKDLEKRNALDKIELLKQIRKKDDEWRNLKVQVDELRHQRNNISIEISKIKKEGGDASAKLKEALQIPKMIQEKEDFANVLRKEIDAALMQLPNILHSSVPIGSDEAHNKVVRKFGKKPKFTFKPRDHVDLLQSLFQADLERAAKISGARFWFLRDKIAQLDLALQKYAADFMVKKGFTLIQPPYMMNRQVYEGVTDLNDFENVMYKIENENLYLIATSEHPLVGMFYDEMLSAECLPIRLVGISACFRKEAGTHGKDEKGIFRGHQFNKVEQVILCRPDDSWKLHEELIKNAEDFFKALGLHCRTVSVCTGDIGAVAAKKYDIECWMPAQDTYREVVSCSNCTDYQARRLKIRYKANDNAKGFAHTLNSTCVATSRAIVGILENYQNKDGSVTIPKVLVPYMNGLKKIEAVKAKK